MEDSLIGQVNGIEARNTGNIRTVVDIQGVYYKSLHGQGHNWGVHDSAFVYRQIPHATASNAKWE